VGNAQRLWEVFVLRFEEALERYRKRRLTAEEAGEILGLSGRHFRRLLLRYEGEGADGLRDRRLGKPSPRRAPAAELSRMQILYQERYRDFTVKHFHEQLQKRHNYKLGYTVTRLALQGAGLVPRHSPEARGRMERVFGTLQSRLPPELRLAEIASIETANRYLKELFVPDYYGSRPGRARSTAPHRAAWGARHRDWSRYSGAALP
jgi:transposase